MKIKQYSEGTTRLFDLTLRRDEFEDLDAGCPVSQFLVSPRAPCGSKFLLYAEPTGFGEVFRQMPDGEDYSINIDLPECNPDRTPSDLENFINSLGRVPIELDMHSGTTHNAGYVLLKVEADIGLIIKNICMTEGEKKGSVQDDIVERYVFEKGHWWLDHVRYVDGIVINDAILRGSNQGENGCLRLYKDFRSQGGCLEILTYTDGPWMNKLCTGKLSYQLDLDLRDRVKL